MVLATSLMLLCGCDDSLKLDHGMGAIRPLVDLDPAMVTSRSSRAGNELSDITVDDLTLSLTNAQGETLYSGTVTDFDTSKGFAVGDYTMTATYGDPVSEGFELPAVYGSTDFTVSEGKTTTPTIEATPSKAMLTLRFDASLTDYMEAMQAAVNTAGGSSVTYTADETRPVYITPGQTAVSLSFTKPNGKSGNVEIASFDAAVKTHYTLLAKLGGDGFGTLEGITVVYDDLLEQEDVTIDISDEVLATPAPVMTAEGFTPGQEVLIVEGTAPADLKPVITVTARGGIAKALLTTANCPSLTDAGWPAQIDLCAATAAERAALEGFGLKAPGLLGVSDKMGLLDLTEVIKHIAARNSALPASTFTLAVTDAAGKTCDPVTFSVKVERLELSAAYSGIYNGEETIDLDITSNGQNLAESLNVEFLNERGTWTPGQVMSVTNARANYVATVKVPADARRPLNIRTSIASVQDQLTVPTAPVITFAANDVFATHAWITVKADDDSTLEIQASTDGGKNYTAVSATKSGNEYHLTGLTGGTAYTLRASASGLPIALTTEATTQLANSDMNNGWDLIKKAYSNYGYSKDMETAPLPWATINDVTCNAVKAVAPGGDSAINSTQKSTMGRNGSNCALLYTVTYDCGTTLSSTSKFALGELYLGSYNNGAVRGINFASRPSALKFWYNFYQSGKIADKGYCEVKVLDASGNVIASGTKECANTGSYPNGTWTEASIPLTYARGANKAAKIEVNFKSSNVANASDAINANKGKATTSSAFFIDDISLVY